MSGPQRHHGQPAMQAEGWGKGSGLPEARQETTSFLQTPVPPPHLPAFPSLPFSGLGFLNLELSSRTRARHSLPDPSYSTPAIRLGGKPSHPVTGGPLVQGGRPLVRGAHSYRGHSLGGSTPCWGALTGEHSFWAALVVGEHSCWGTSWEDSCWATLCEGALIGGTHWEHSCWGALIGEHSCRWLSLLQ